MEVYLTEKLIHGCVVVVQTNGFFNYFISKGFPTFGWKGGGLSCNEWLEVIRYIYNHPLDMKQA